ncbi:unknown [Megasphaera elsdenii CAG:570]|uniref:Uncharacterized protein n=1 Tax=Megasphaera elsdenii CAG:570 TaxID=1263087 RepID=R7MX49_MEGEL|nr:unknown [Megasphaera elsdenii CAG:570]
MLVRRRHHFPAKSRDVACQVFCLDGHFKLQRVYQFPLALLHGCQLFGQGGFAIGDDVFCRFLFQDFQVCRLAGLVELFRHLLGHVFRFGDEAGRAAQLMLFRVPEEVEEQHFFLAWEEPRAASDHLTVQAAALRSPQDDDAVYRWAVPAFRQQHRITEDVVFTGIEVGQDLRPVFAVAIDFGGPEAGFIQDVTEFLACRNERQEDDGLAVLAVGLHFPGNLAKIWVQCRPQFTGFIVAGRKTDAGNIDL